MTTQPLPVIPKPTFSVKWQWSNQSRSMSSHVEFNLLALNCFGQLLRTCCSDQTMNGVAHSRNSFADRQTITIDFATVPNNVQFLVAVVTVPKQSASGKENLKDLFSALSIESLDFNYQYSLRDRLNLCTNEQDGIYSHTFVPFVCIRYQNTSLFNIYPLSVIDTSADGLLGGRNYIWNVVESVMKSYIHPVIWDQVVPHNGVELLNIEKGQQIKLPVPKKLEQQPESFTVHFFGLGWAPNKQRGENFDIDMHAYCLDFDKKRVQDHVYYGKRSSDDGALQLSEDDRTGDGDDTEDDEKMFVKLDKLDSKIDAIFIVVQIYTGQTFARVSNEFCRAVDIKGNVMAKFALDKEDKFENASAAVMCVLRPYNKNGWIMHAIGEPISLQQVQDNVTAYKTLIKLLD